MKLKKRLKMNVNINPTKTDETVIQPESNLYSAIETCAEYGSIAIIPIGLCILVIN